ncbi:hypothetical protein MUK42_30524 [Musa troglodytarum]|uniref:Uncharacterized protein n=1 Tax=Musa troglodytarum TaxID=320322 RepID=A0A9E7JX41_9LILI|nr:hypothetical protein MUK42_30524 [Musa troglodytarum]
MAENFSPTGLETLPNGDFPKESIICRTLELHAGDVFNRWRYIVVKGKHLCGSLFHFEEIPRSEPYGRSRQDFDRNFSLQLRSLFCLCDNITTADETISSDDVGAANISMIHSLHFTQQDPRRVLRPITGRQSLSQLFQRGSIFNQELANLKNRASSKTFQAH